MIDESRSHESPETDGERSSIDSASVFHALRTNEVITVNNRDEIRITDSFENKINENHQLIRDTDNSELHEKIEAAVSDEISPDQLVKISEIDEEFIAEYLSLAHLDGLSEDNRLRALSLFDSLRRSVPDKGAPEPFVPIRGVRLSLLLPVYERAIVYTWKEDCPPCDLMKGEFESIFTDPTTDIALFAVYGPNWAELLHEEYNVIGGPTTLFCYKGRVDARLSGAYAKKIIQSEVEKLRTTSYNTE